MMFPNHDPLPTLERDFSRHETSTHGEDFFFLIGRVSPLFPR